MPIPFPIRTKIVATLGPASAHPQTIIELLQAGVDVFRLNFSHGTHEHHGETIQHIRYAARHIDRPVAILQDLQGPKIRTGTLAGGGSAILERGATLTITTRPVPGDAREVSTTYAGLPADVTPGARLLVDDGRIELSVQEVAGTDVRCVVVVGGELKDHKGINLPGINVSAPSLTEKDLEDLAFGLDQGVDLVALSFVRTGEDLDRLRQHVTAHPRSRPKIIAKIEKPEALENLDPILERCDGIMVARGDLGVEVGTEAVPVIQRRLIRAAAARGLPVIVATQMLESMMTAPRPTRAEASDVANAIFDGADAVMLSGETAAGLHPLRCVQTMARIVRAAEQSQEIDFRPAPMATSRTPDGQPVLGDIATQAAVHAARAAGARLIVTFTFSGAIARRVAQQRPPSDIVAFSAREETLRQLALVWGVRPLDLAKGVRSQDLFRIAEAQLLERGLAARGDVVVMVSGSNNLPGSANLVKLHRLGEEFPAPDAQEQQAILRRLA